MVSTTRPRALRHKAEDIPIGVKDPFDKFPVFDHAEAERKVQCGGSEARIILAATNDAAAQLCELRNRDTNGASAS
jgi:hypothetical protein